MSCVRVGAILIAEAGYTFVSVFGHDTTWCIPRAATVVGRVTYSTDFGHARAVRRLAIIIACTSDTPTVITIHQANGRIPTTTRIVGAITAHADLIHTLPVISTAIGIVLAGYTAVSSNAGNTHRRGTGTTAIISRITHCTLTSNTLTIGTTAIPIAPTGNAAQLTALLDAEIPRVAATIGDGVTSDTGTIVADRRIGIGTIIVASTGDAFKARCALDAIRRIRRTARAIEWVTELTGIVHALLGAITIVICSTGRTPTTIGIGHTPRRRSTTPSVIGLIADHADISYALVTAITISIASATDTAVTPRLGYANGGVTTAASAIIGVTDLTATSDTFAVIATTVAIISAAQTLRLAGDINTERRIAIAATIVDHITGETGTINTLASTRISTIRIHLAEGADISVGGCYAIALDVLAPLIGVRITLATLASATDRRFSILAIKILSAGPTTGPIGSLVANRGVSTAADIAE